MNMTVATARAIINALTVAANTAENGGEADEFDPVPALATLDEVSRTQLSDALATIAASAPKAKAAAK